MTLEQPNNNTSSPISEVSIVQGEQGQIVSDSESDLEEFEDASEVDIEMKDAEEDKEADVDFDFHDLYLPADTTAHQTPIRFSGGMTHAQCEEYYRALELEETRRTSKRRRRQIFFNRRNSKSRKEVEFNATEEAQLVDAIAITAPSGKAMRRDSSSSVASTVSTSSCSSSSLSSEDSAASRISFHENVTVYPVRSIEDFPDDVWEATWKPRAEVRAHKKRSKKEYAWDGYDWQNATEEDDMIMDPETGELEHPVHYEANHLALASARGPVFAFRLGL